MDLKKLLKAYFEIDYPISGGMGNSIDSPIIIHRQVPNDYTSVEYGILRCLGIGRRIQWKMVLQTLLEHNGRMLDRIDRNKQTPEDEVITQIEYCYFDITECYGRSNPDVS